MYRIVFDANDPDAYLDFTTKRLARRFINKELRIKDYNQYRIYRLTRAELWETLKYIVRHKKDYRQSEYIVWCYRYMLAMVLQDK